MPKAIEDAHHVIRYVRKKLLRRDENGNVLGLLPQALELREHEDALSISWLEYCGLDYEEGFANSVAEFRQNLTIKAKDGFAAGEVGKFKAICQDSNVRVRILHAPEPKFASHGAVRGLKKADLGLLDLLALEVFHDTRLSSQFPET